MRIFSEPIKKEIGQKLKQIRRKMGLDRREMAAWLKVAPNTYSKNESGESFPNFVTLSNMANHHGISMDWLLMGKGPMHFKKKANLDTLEEELAETKKKLENLEHERDDFIASYHQQLKTDVPELIENIQNDRRLYLKIMTAFQEYKDKYKDKGE